jgi:hypothetical protein
VTLLAGKPVTRGAELIFCHRVADYSGVRSMSDDSSNKVLVKRPTKIKTDSRGRSVWADPIESARLELVSTQTLKQILSSSDAGNRKAIEAAASTATDGVLARDPATGFFEIIDDAELQAILEANVDMPKLSRPVDVTLEPLHDFVDEDKLSLVSTMALRKVLAKEGDNESPNTEIDLSGMDPYNSS